MTCEGVPALFGFSLGGSASALQTIPLKSNVVDVTILEQSPSACTAVVSVDSLHIRGSTTEIRKDEVSQLAGYILSSDTNGHRSRLVCSSSATISLGSGRKMSLVSKSSSGSARTLAGTASLLMRRRSATSSTELRTSGSAQARRRIRCAAFGSRQILSTECGYNAMHRVEMYRIKALDMIFNTRYRNHIAGEEHMDCRLSAICARRLL